MKRLFTILTTLALLCAVSCEEQGDDNVNPNEKPAGERIASVEEQMEAIAASLPELKAAASALGNLVDALSPNNVAPATRTENNSNNGVKDQIAELEERIEELEEFIANGGANKEWLDATYATLEMYEETIALLTALQAEVDALKEHISGSTYDLFAEVDSKIESSCESMKEWINEQLSGYYNIAEVDALLSQLEASLTEDSAELRASIEELRESLQHSLGEMREEYKAAIAEAIGEYDGVITEKIASEIEAVNERIDSEIAALNKRLDDIEARLEELENAVTNLINRIQSITYVPTHEDGKARVDCHNASIEGSTMTMDFIISPKSTVADIAERYEEILSVEADIIPDFTQTVYKTVGLPVIDCTADTAKGVISVTVACDNLSDSFFTTKWSARAILTISDGNNDRNTEYIELFPRYYKQANNMIKYTTWDRKPIAVNWKHGIEELQLNTYDGEYGFLVFYFDVSVIPEDAFADCDNLTTVSLPTTITNIRTNAFMSCNGLGQIDIPEGVISIEDGAFQDCNSLTSVTIPDSVTSIGAHAFEGCHYLTSITIPDNVSSIGWWAFSACLSLSSITIPDSITSISNGAFAGCRSLASINIPGSITSIGDQAFVCCESLTSITIPDGVTTIGVDVFHGCMFERDNFTNNSSLDAVTNNYWGALLYDIIQEDGLCIDGTTAVACRRNATSITIPNSVTSIGEWAFHGCFSLTSITIPDSVTSIGESAFQDCHSLTSVTIPESVVSIGYDVFGGCTSLSEFKGRYASEDGRCIIVDGTLNSFAPAGLTEYTIPEGVTSIGEWAFHSCYSLTNITIPDGVTSIGYNAFAFCKKLANITIPENVTAIGELAFAYCENLAEVYCKPIIPPTAVCNQDNSVWKAFRDNASRRKIYVPTESVDAYKSAEGWSDYAYYIVGYDFE